MAMSTNSTPLPGRDKSIDYISEPDRAFRSLLIDFDNAECVFYAYNFLLEYSAVYSLYL